MNSGKQGATSRSSFAILHEVGHAVETKKNRDLLNDKRQKRADLAKEIKKAHDDYWGSIANAMIMIYFTKAIARCSSHVPRTGWHLVIALAK
jgi:hypothetical protein